MNNARRKAISTIIHSITDLNEKFFASVDELCYEIEAVQDNEREALDNMPESMEGSERYSAMESAIESLQSAMDSLDEAATALNESVSEPVSSLEEASA